MTDETFSTPVQVRMDPETKRRVEDLAKVTERDVSKMIRHLINQAWEQKFGINQNAPPPPIAE